MKRKLLLSLCWAGMTGSLAAAAPEAVRGFQQTTDAQIAAGIADRPPLHSGQTSEPVASVRDSRSPSPAPSFQPYCQIHVIDEETGRGVPLVELETVNHLRFVTDSAGRVAFQKPGLMGQTVFFHVRSHGYEFPKDGFGYAGVRLEIRAGQNAVVRLKRLNIAERLYRVTGEGIYDDSVRLGERAPIQEPWLNAQVAGQDSVQATPYHGKLYWFWGDTSRLKYPLGNFRTTGATSLLPRHGGLDPAQGVDLAYFTDAEGFTRPMCPFEPKSGMVWIDGLLAVRDEAGRERLVAHYARMKSLGEMVEHGLIRFNEERNEFERLAQFDLHERRRCPRGHPFRQTEGGVEYFYFGDAFPDVRVKAELTALRSQANYAAWSCLAQGSRTNSGSTKVERDADGQLRYRWAADLEPVGVKEESRLVGAGLMKDREAHFLPIDVDTGKRIRMHGGSVRWNAYRRRWVLIAVEQGGTSFLGEVWYSEADGPTGPWLRAKKIATHTRYSFYNPVHHEFFDQDGGRLIYFEGTYANTFSGNDLPTPRYDYNQIMYRLDLADPRLAAVEK